MSGQAKDYPVPDRSGFEPNKHRADPVMPEGDLGQGDGLLPDGRPYLVEAWYSEGATYLTIFFSALDLEEATTAELLELLTQFLVDARVPGKWRTPSRVHPRVITDSAGEHMYTVTFGVGEPEY